MYDNPEIVPEIMTRERAELTGQPMYELPELGTVPVSVKYVSLPKDRHPETGEELDLIN